MNRRTALVSAAWSVPVIALAVAAPAAAASTVAPTPFPASCHEVDTDPETMTRYWIGIYSDGSTVEMKHSYAMSSVFGPLCRAAGTNPGAGK